MCDADALPQAPLQNHLFVSMQRTTVDGSWMPQYVHAHSGSSTSTSSS